MKKFLQGFALLFCFIESIIKVKGVFFDRKSFNDKIKRVCTYCDKSVQRIKKCKMRKRFNKSVFLRSGTSIGANIREAFYAHGKADFVAKLQIALKECSESEYWIELLIESGYYNNKEILNKCVEIKRILITSINTAKENNR